MAEPASAPEEQHVYSCRIAVVSRSSGAPCVRRSHGAPLERESLLHVRAINMLLLRSRSRVSQVCSKWKHDQLPPPPAVMAPSRFRHKPRVGKAQPWDCWDAILRFSHQTTSPYLPKSRLGVQIPDYEIRRFSLNLKSLEYSQNCHD